MLARQPKDIQRYILNFLGKSRDTSIKQTYIDVKFRSFLSIINHRVTVHQYFENMCKFIRLNKIILWRIWCVQFPSLYLYYWEEILINNHIFFNIRFSDLDYSVNNNIRWMKLA